MRIQTTSQGGFNRMRIKSMRIHVNATDPDRMRSKVPCESALKIIVCYIGFQTGSLQDDKADIHKT